MNHSLIVTKNEKMICQFCNSVCLKGSKDRKRYWWWECKECNIRFLVSIKGNIDIIEFESKEENNKFYTIHLFIKKKRSDICVWSKEPANFIMSFNKSKWSQTIAKPYYTQDLVTSFNQILEINPTNFQDKLKTYLLLL